jgi:formiminoglutamase
VGLLQLDAHHDVRDWRERISNGCPVRGLVDEGVIAGGDVVQVGILPFSNHVSLRSWCDANDVTRYTADDVRSIGARSVIREALDRLRGCDAVYLTVDIDVLDRAFAPGTVAAVPGGITPAELFACVAEACANPLLRGMDIVELDPARDVSNVTVYAAAQVVLAAVSAIVHRMNGSMAEA